MGSTRPVKAGASRQREGRAIRRVAVTGCRGAIEGQCCPHNWPSGCLPQREAGRGAMRGGGRAASWLSVHSHRDVHREWA